MAAIKCWGSCPNMTFRRIRFLVDKNHKPMTPITFPWCGCDWPELKGYKEGSEYLVYTEYYEQECPNPSGPVRNTTPTTKGPEGQDTARCSWPACACFRSDPCRIGWPKRDNDAGGSNPTSTRSEGGTQASEGECSGACSASPCEQAVQASAPNPPQSEVPVRQRQEVQAMSRHKRVIQLVRDHLWFLWCCMWSDGFIALPIVPRESDPETWTCERCQAKWRAR